ncbi:helix-turn-helix transcriptional regulator [Cohnella sp. LGH]|nr:helix-turn-helix transcriptional regulator [Cohnella sp. LGH]
MEDYSYDFPNRRADSTRPRVLVQLAPIRDRGTGHSPASATADISYSTTFLQDLDRPFVSYNAELLEMLTPALDRALDEHLRSRSLCEAVKQLQKRNLVGGRPDIRIVASELGMSDRTLQRRLRDEGTSFKHLLAQARHEQALSYLADPSLDIKEIAFLVGYEDQNSFYRAFRLWERDTPANWRVRHEVWRSELVTGPV